MAKRRYTQRLRAQAAEENRQRILDALYERLREAPEPADQRRRGGAARRRGPLDDLPRLRLAQRALRRAHRPPADWRRLPADLEAVASSRRAGVAARRVRRGRRHVRRPPRGLAHSRVNGEARPRGGRAGDRPRRERALARRGAGRGASPGPRRPSPGRDSGPRHGGTLAAGGLRRLRRARYRSGAFPEEIADVLVDTAESALLADR